ncbi:hypothetical protein HYV11_02675 [Candidatus Dependentiae bacterium]|nr:hypothetical protein [Candidatus Dependentiae bacterium]
MNFMDMIFITFVVYFCFLIIARYKTQKTWKQLSLSFFVTVVIAFLCAKYAGSCLFSSFLLLLSSLSILSKYVSISFIRLTMKYDINLIFLNSYASFFLFFKKELIPFIFLYILLLVMLLCFELEKSRS